MSSTGSLDLVGELGSPSSAEQLRQAIDAVDPDRPHPGQVVEPDVLELDPLRARRRSWAANRRWKPIATLHRPMRAVAGVEERLGDDPDRVREVDDPGAGRGPPGGLLGELEHDRDRPQRLGEAARARSSPGRCSRSEAGSSRRGAAPPGRRPAAGRPRSRPRRGRRRGRSVCDQAPGPAPAASIRPARPATIASRSGSMSSRTSSSIGQALGACGEALDELRGVGAAAADDRDLQAHRTASRPSATVGGVLTSGRPTAPRIVVYNVISKWPSDRLASGSGSMARFRLEPGPVPLHHQVYLDLSRRARRAASGAPATACRPERELCAQLRLQPDHRPAGARRARPRGPPRADPGPRHVRPPAARSCTT